MAKEIYIDENGNENLVSGTINYGSLLPMSPSDPDFVADRITALETAYSNIGVMHSITLDIALTTTSTDYNTYNSRKFSDYDLIIFRFGASTTDTRQTVVIPQSIWKSGQVINMGALHGSSASTPSSYSYSSVNITYKSDTSLTALASGSAMLNTLFVYGVKL